MQSGDGWRSVFESWPQAIPREGILMTTFNESIPFKDFLVSNQILMVERPLPDTVGARKVMIAYSAISAVKLPSPLDLPRFTVMGFQAPF